MTGLLLVASDPERTARLTRALGREGFSVKVAPEGLYALTMLERERPSLLLVDGAKGDLPADELASIVRSDPALRGVALVVAVRSAEPAPEGFDLVVDGDLPLADLAATIRRRTSERTGSGTRTLSGSLETLDLPQVSEVLGQSRRTGRLSLVFPDERVGEIYFDQGQVVHVRFGAGEGRTAFSALFAAAQWRVGVSFHFEVLTREEVFRYPRSLVADVQELLLHTAVDLDELHRFGGHDQGRTG
jgi:CheY-like chemotaxis protein